MRLRASMLITNTYRRPRFWSPLVNLFAFMLNTTIENDLFIYYNVKRN